MFMTLPVPGIDFKIISASKSRKYTVPEPIFEPENDWKITYFLDIIMKKE